MKQNEGTVDRVIRIILGVILIGGGFYAKYNIPNTLWISITSWIVGGISLITGLTGFCGLYAIFGIKTCRTKN